MFGQFLTVIEKSAILTLTHGSREENRVITEISGVGRGAGGMIEDERRSAQGSGSAGPAEAQRRVGAAGPYPDPSAGDVPPGAARGAGGLSPGGTHPAPAGPGRAAGAYRPADGPV